MLRLVEITADNRDEILSLSVDPSQEAFVASNEESLRDAEDAREQGGQVFPFGLYDGAAAVGFLMVGYHIVEEGSPQIAAGSYVLWRLMIDRRYQGRGYGREAVALAIAFIRSAPAGSASCCWLSYEPENRAAKQLYASLGFVENGEEDCGERVAVLPL